jgi:DNA-binding MarR family transcriptional regulator
VLEHVRQFIRLRRPDVPPWIADTELTFNQLRLLFRLQRDGPTPMHLLAGWLGVDKATATGFVKRVERRGLVARQRREDDHRVVECRLSDAGAALVTEIDGLRLDAMRQVLGLLDETKLTELDRLLSLIIERSRESGS